jgi:hypothetical protein
MPRPSKPPTSQQITVRVSDAMVGRADNCIDTVGRTMASPPTRADVWRLALVIGLAELEKRGK